MRYAELNCSLERYQRLKECSRYCRTASKKTSITGKICWNCSLRVKSINHQYKRHRQAFTSCIMLTVTSQHCHFREDEIICFTSFAVMKTQ